jgi:hypothetical protein
VPSWRANSAKAAGGRPPRSGSRQPAPGDQRDDSGRRAALVVPPPTGNEARAKTAGGREEEDVNRPEPRAYMRGCPGHAVRLAGFLRPHEGSSSWLARGAMRAVHHQTHGFAETEGSVRWRKRIAGIGAIPGRSSRSFLGLRSPDPVLGRCFLDDGEPAINGDHGTLHESRLIRGEENRQVGNFGSLAETLQRDGIGGDVRQGCGN